MRENIPSVADLASALKRAQYYCGDCNDGWVDIRLQVTEGGWVLRTGDASYDQDHRGYWGASSVSLECNLDEIAKDLIDQVEEDIAMCGDID